MAVFACLLEMITDRNTWNMLEIIKSTDASTDFYC